MSLKRNLYTGVAAIALAGFLAAAPARLDAQQPPVNVGATDLGGVVTGPNGPEAGVWVIAETTDLPTRMAKIVTTISISMTEKAGRDRDGGRVMLLSTTGERDAR